MHAHRAGQQVLAIVIGGLLALSAPAAAQGPYKPFKVVPPQIGGTTVLGITDLGSWAWGYWVYVPAPGDVGYQWLSCASSDPWSCAPMAGQTGPTYTVTSDDAGRSLILDVRVARQGVWSEWSWSNRIDIPKSFGKVAGQSVKPKPKPHRRHPKRAPKHP